MKKLLLLTLILLSFIGIIGCGKKDGDLSDKKENDNKTSIENGIPNKEVKEFAIGEGITIKEGLPSNVPGDLPLIIEVKTYTKSNLPNYLFYIIKGQTSDKPGKWFIDELKKNGYNIMINPNLPKDKQGVDYSDMEFVKRDSNGNDLGKIQIFIHDSVPDNIKKGLGLEGLFIEIFYE